MNWIYFKYDDEDFVKPQEYGRYLVCRKDGKIHMETWNGTGWAYNHTVIRFYLSIVPPIIRRNGLIIYTNGEYGNERDWRELSYRDGKIELQMV